MLQRNAKFGGALIGPRSLHGIVFLSSGSQSWTGPALDQCWHLHAEVPCSANRGGHLQQLRALVLYPIGKQPIRLFLYHRVTLTGSGFDP